MDHEGQLELARHRRPPPHPLLHCVLLMSQTFPEGSDGNGAMQGPVMVHHPC